MNSTGSTDVPRHASGNIFIVMPASIIEDNNHHREEGRVIHVLLPKVPTGAKEPTQGLRLENASITMTRVRNGTFKNSWKFVPEKEKDIPIFRPDFISTLTKTLSKTTMERGYLGRNESYRHIWDQMPQDSSFVNSFLPIKPLRWFVQYQIAYNTATKSTMLQII